MTEKYEVDDLYLIAKKCCRNINIEFRDDYIQEFVMTGWLTGKKETTCKSIKRYQFISSRKNAYDKYIKSSFKQKMITNLEEDSLDKKSEELQVVDKLIHIELINKVRNVSTSLKGLKRQIIDLYLEGLSIKEIAKTIGYSLEYTRLKFTEARSFLKCKLNELR